MGYFILNDQSISFANELQRHDMDRGWIKSTKLSVYHRGSPQD